MGFTKAFLVSILKIITLFKPSFVFKHSENYLGTMIASIVATISLETLNQIFFKNANPKYIWMPIFIEAIMIFIYLWMVFIDLIIGSRASMKAGKEFEFNRLIDSFAKTFATILITSVMMFICMIIESLHTDWITLTSILSLTFLWVVIILYEFSSIGRHLENLWGSKPGIFTFMDNVSGVLRDKAIKKIENSFNLKEDEKDHTDT